MSSNALAYEVRNSPLGCYRQQELAIVFFWLAVRLSSQSVLVLVVRLYPSLFVGCSDVSRENVRSIRGGVFGSRWESQLYFLGVATTATTCLPSY